MPGPGARTDALPLRGIQVSSGGAGAFAMRVHLDAYLEGDTVAGRTAAVQSRVARPLTSL